MRIAVYGLWHLGCVTAACLASAGHRVVGLDLDGKVVEDLQRGEPPLEEPGLTDLVGAGLAASSLSFTAEPARALSDAEVLWVTFDTPVNERDEADTDYLRERLNAIASEVRPGTLVLISSQVPAGFTRALEQAWAGRGVRFAYSPENLRLGKALDSFRKPERVVIGPRDPADRARLAALFAPFCERIEWMTVESAEATKHALNAFLALSVTFINELARLCEAVGADAKEVERGLRSEGRIGPRAYLAPGAAFAGGTLARDVRFLIELGRRHHVGTPLFEGVLASNDLHKGWLRDAVARSLDGVGQAIVAVLGLTYKPGTSTLRRSSSVELCHWLHKQGVRVQAHDPTVREQPVELPVAVEVCETPTDALRDAAVAVIATEWPVYRDLGAEQFLSLMRRPRIIDPNWFLASALANDARVAYVAPGRTADHHDSAPTAERK